MGKDHFYGDVESYIIHLLEVHTRVSVSDLCATFGLAPSTIRKKLADMEGRGLLIRTHGGAVNIPQKKAIASAAVELVNNGDTIALGGGSTVAELCVYLLKLRDSMILTDSIVVANLVIQNRNVEVRINSGIVRGRTGCVVGPNSASLFKNMPVEKAFVGCDTFHLGEGAGSANILVGEVEREILRNARERYILCDSSKLNKTTVFSIMPCSELTALITDDDADPYYIDQLRSSGLEVIVAPVFRTKRNMDRLGKF